MGETNVEETIKQDEEGTLAIDTKTVKLDVRTLKKIIECCQENQADTLEHVTPCSLIDMGFLFDESIKCNLICNQDSLRAAIAKVVENGIHTDVKVIVHGHTFDCHLAVLQVSTEYFKQFSSTNLIVVNVVQLTKAGFEMAYEWMIKPDMIPHRSKIIELYLAARFLNMPHLINQLWYCFENIEFFREGEAFKLYLQATPHPTATLQSLLLTRVNRFFLPAVATVEYLQLKAEQVYDMLTTSVIAVNSEMEVFLSAFRWLMYEWETRKAHTELLMKAVRFNLMPAWYILSLKTKQAQPELAELLSNPTVHSTVNGGLSYTVTQHFIHSESPLHKPLQMHNTQQREWVIDELAGHHHLYKCPKWQYLDYEHFNIYLEQIITAGPHHYLTLKPFKPSNFLPCCQAVVQNCKTIADM
ncbi:kelch-like protein 15 [Drosophila hydei]|uniref:Kelch-like protein 15 n=1 Tax=Drosophila hydei TaxID=7224 RepID=A0A6J1LWX9_DROHY|nr:kelch-like protein 15 [Drosophila hydei]